MRAGQLRKLRRKEATAATAARSCGACTACCTVHKVVELNKDYGVRCQHLSDAGCGVYTKRPQSCKDWYCLWRWNVLSEAERPDLSGVMLDRMPADPLFPDGKALVAREVWSGAFDQQQSLLDRMALTETVVLCYSDGRKVTIGPPAKLIGVQTRANVRRHLPVS